jgi:hypothetical protein
MPFSASDAISALYPKLGGTSAADITGWTDAELYAWMDEASDCFARKFGGWVERDTSRSTAAGVSSYAAPARHIGTRHVTAGGAILRASSVADLEALDPDWRTAPGPPKRWTLEAAGLANLVLYPVPVAITPLAILFFTYPETVTSGSTLAGPTPMQDYFSYCVLAEARSKEGQGTMPEIAARLKPLIGVYEAAFARYFGGTQ